MFRFLTRMLYMYIIHRIVFEDKLATATVASHVLHMIEENCVLLKKKETERVKSLPPSLPPNLSSAP